MSKGGLLKGRCQSPELESSLPTPLTLPSFNATIIVPYFVIVPECMVPECKHGHRAISHRQQVKR